jgi:hypothetical protein
MARARASQPSSATHSDDAAWQRLELSESILPAAVAAFGSPSQAERWISVLDQYYGYWRKTQFLVDLRESGLTRDDFERWCSAGVNPPQVPALAKRMDLEQTLTMQREKGLKSYELLSLLDAGVSIDELRRLTESGLTGDALFGWSLSRLPTTQWLEWRAFGIDPRAARELYAAGEHRPEVARRWMDTPLSLESTVAYIRQGCSPDEAVELARIGVQPQDLLQSPEGFQVATEDLGLAWTDLFARPRSSAPVFAVHPGITQDLWSRTSPFEELSERLHRALADLGSYGVSMGTMFDTHYYGLAFLDGGWAKRVPYALNGPVREWVVGVDAMALLCRRLRARLPRTGRFRSVPSEEELEARWDIQCRDDKNLRARSGLLAEAGFRPQLEELAFRLRSPDPIPRPRKPPPQET